MRTTPTSSCEIKANIEPLHLKRQRMLVKNIREIHANRNISPMPENDRQLVAMTTNTENILPESSKINLLNFFH
jgi:hypothetical protein